MVKRSTQRDQASLTSTQSSKVRLGSHLTGSVTKNSSPPQLVQKDLIHNILPDLGQNRTVYDHNSVCTANNTIVFHSCLEKYEQTIMVGVAVTAARQHQGVELFDDRHEQARGWIR